jgi:hypothetical protein
MTPKPKLSKNELKREHRKRISTITSAIKAHCYQCGGFNGDAYGDCEIYQCPLYPFQIDRGDYHSKKTRPVLDEVKRLYKEADGHPLKCSRDHWFQFFGINSSGRKTVKKKTNLRQEGGDVE